MDVLEALGVTALQTLAIDRSVGDRFSKIQNCIFISFLFRRFLNEATLQGFDALSYSIEALAIQFLGHTIKTLLPINGIPTQGFGSSLKALRVRKAGETTFYLQK